MHDDDDPDIPPEPMTLAEIEAGLMTEDDIKSLWITETEMAELMFFAAAPAEPGGERS